jgi:hypothetical protein
MALAGCATEPSLPFQPAIYVLQSVGGRPVPATHTSVVYPDRENRSIFVYDTVTIVSDSQFVRSFQVVSLTVRPSRTDTAFSQSARFEGRILRRDDAVLLLPPELFGSSIETIELLPSGSNLRRRIRSSEYQCGELPPWDCEALRDELVDALYVRR